MGDDLGSDLPSLSAMPVGDLFSLAGALADLLDAPVTIEDHDTAVLAYSDGQLLVDAARTETILGRRVPPEYQEALRRAGVYRRIVAEPGVVYADLADAGMKPRVIVGVRAGGELLGSVWAALDGPPSEEQERVLLDAAPIVAEYMLRDRAQRDLAGRTRSEQVAALLRGGADAESTAAQLGLAGGSTVVAVVALSSGPQTGAGMVPRIDRIADALSLHLRAVEPRSAAAVLDGRIYVVLRAGSEAAHRIVSDFLARGPHRGQLVVGVGRAVGGPAELHRSRSDADDIVHVLIGRGGTGVAVSIEEAFVDVVVWRVARTLGADSLGDFGPLPALARHDAVHGSAFVATARAYLAHGGDVRSAATALHIHSNTLRNRVRKASEACGVDLDDADTRLAVMLQLRAAEFRDV